MSRVMTVLACLQAPPPPMDTLLFSDGLFDGSGIVALLAMALAAAAAPVLRWRDRVRVMRLVGLNQVAARPTGQDTAAPVQAATPALSAVDVASLGGCRAWGPTRARPQARQRPSRPGPAA